MNMSEIHLHVEQFSLKTNWRLVDSCEAKAVGKIHTESDRNGRETVRLGPPSQRETSEEKWNYKVLERSKVFDPHVGHPGPGVQHQENKSS